MDNQISYAKTVYGQDEIDAVVKCLNESTQMGKMLESLNQKLSIICQEHCLL